MKITGTRCYIDIEYDDKTARFGGELGIDGFYATANTMRWLPPHENMPVTDEKRLSLMRAVREDVKDNKYKVFFTNDKNEDLEF